MAVEQFVTQIYGLMISWTMVVLIILLIVKIIQSLGGNIGWGRPGDGNRGDRERREREREGGGAGGQAPGQVQNLQGQMNIP